MDIPHHSLDTPPHGEAEQYLRGGGGQSGAPKDTPVLTIGTDNERGITAGAAEFALRRHGVDLGLPGPSSFV